MLHQTNRRGFLMRSGLACAGLSGAAITGAWSGRTSAIEPIARRGPAKFKFSLAAYSYRDLLNGDPPLLSLTNFVNDCAALGLEGTELTSYYFPDPVTEDYLRQLKQQCFLLGLDVSGTAVGNDFGLPPGEERRQQLEHVRRWIEHAEILGAPVIRIFAGHAHHEDTAQAHRWMVEGIEECCDYAGQHGVHLALENHGGPTATADGMLAFVRDVRSPWFGINLDTGNFHSEDIYGDLALLAPYTLNVQVKIRVSGPDGQQQPSDLGRLAEILRAALYRGYIVLEYEESGDPRTECRKHMDQLRAAFG